MSQFIRLACGAGLALAACVSASAQTFNAKAVTVEKFIGTVTVVESTGPGMVVTVAGGGEGVAQPSVRMVDGRVLVDGGQSLKNLNCRREGGQTFVKLGMFGANRALTDYPTLTIRAPRDVALRIRKSLVAGSTGQLGAADLALAGCADFKIAGVKGRLDAALAGSGSLTVGPVGESEVDVAGSGSVGLGPVAGQLAVSIAGAGDVRVGAVAGRADLSTAGSGKVALASVSGPVDISIAGSGGVDIAGGRATAFDLSIAGSGDVNFRGVAVNPSVSIMGSGNVRIAKLEGKLSQSKAGTGSVVIGAP